MHPKFWSEKLKGRDHLEESIHVAQDRDQ